MAKDTKLLRGQIRQVVKEILPDVLTEELAKAILQQLQLMTRTQLNAIEAQVRDSLQALDDRSREVQNYVIRQTAASTFLPENKQ